MIWDYSPGLIRPADPLMLDTKRRRFSPLARRLAVPEGPTCGCDVCKQKVWSFI